MKLFYPKKGFLNYKESILKFDDAEVPYEPFCCVEEKNNPSGVKLLIGYYENGSALVIGSTEITSTMTTQSAEVDFVKKVKYIDFSFYKKVKRPDGIDSIFRKPKLGDTVLCVANKRYLGCDFGSTYKVESISHEGRIGFDKFAQYTYESKYFIVVKSNHTNNNSTWVIQDDIGDIQDSSLIRSRGFKVSNGTTEVTQELDELISRTRLEEDAYKEREVYSPTLIKREINKNQII